ncbi:MAG: hypothetical protein NTX45_29240 [Proteobacteria bacterium]|nr:hypothetical protein [Pseudomonadota bacterium]
MSTPVEFALALSSSSPSGTGSYYYTGEFKIVVQNLAYQKQVSIWAQVGGSWKDIDAHYVQSLPRNLELWSAPASNSEGEFVAKYAVLGTTYWDNNGWMNYIFPQVADDFAALAGKGYKVVLGKANLADSTLHIDIGVQNIAYHKVVGIVFTTDNWATVQTAYANYRWTMNSGLEVWEVLAAVGAATEAKFAVFYRVAGSEYWDNNFWRNYRITPSSPHQWGDSP